MKKKVPYIFRKAFDKANESNYGILTSAIKKSKERGLVRLIEKFSAKLEASMIMLMEEMKNDSYIPMYLLNSIKAGKPKSEILSEKFKVDVNNYKTIEVHDNIDITLDSEDYIKKFLLLNRDVTTLNVDNKKGRKKKDPLDANLSTVSFENIPEKTKEERIEELKRLKYNMETMPKPHTIHIAMTKEQAQNSMDVPSIEGEFIASELCITHNIKTHYVAAAVINNDDFIPLVSKIVDEDKYPQQLFTDEYEEWIQELKGMWVTNNLKTGLILYYIDLIKDNFYYEGFVRRWNRMGGGGGSIAAIEQKLPNIPVSTLQNEYFGKTVYRVPAGDYDTPIAIPTSNTFVADFRNDPVLVTETNPNTNKSCIKFNINNSPLSTPQTYYRLFGTDPNRPKSNALIQMKGCDQQIKQSMFTNNEIIIDIKLPGLTGWMSLNNFFQRRGFDGSDGLGIVLSYGRVGQGVLDVTFEDFNTADCGNQCIMRITMTNNSPKLTQINFLDWKSLTFPERV